jgi:hypothetical protein
LPDLKASVTPAKTAIVPVEKDPSKAADALAGTATNVEQDSVFGKLFNGFLLGLLGYAVYLKRRPIYDFALSRVKK